jgi:hypothetical protein
LSAIKWVGRRQISVTKSEAITKRKISSLFEESISGN